MDAATLELLESVRAELTEASMADVKATIAASQKQKAAAKKKPKLKPGEKMVFGKVVKVSKGGKADAKTRFKKARQAKRRKAAKSKVGYNREVERMKKHYAGRGVKKKKGMKEAMESLLEGGMGASPWKSAQRAYMDGVKAVDKMSPDQKVKANAEAIKAMQKLKGFVGTKVEKMLHDAPGRADVKVRDIVDDLYHLWYYAGMMDQS